MSHMQQIEGGEMAMAGLTDEGLWRMDFSLQIEADWPPVSVETLWVEAITVEKFRIDSIPFFVKGIAVNDIVGGEADSEGRLHYTRKLEEGGHSTIQVITIRDDATPGVRSELARIGCVTEGSPWPSLFTIDIPDRKLLAQVHRLLRERAELGEIEYEDAFLASSEAGE
jgi:hypothetical protein